MKLYSIIMNRKISRVGRWYIMLTLFYEFASQIISWDNWYAYLVCCLGVRAPSSVILPELLRAKRGIGVCAQTPRIPLGAKVENRLVVWSWVEVGCCETFDKMEMRRLGYL